MFLRAARLKLEDIGGAEVRAAFRSGTRYLRSGDKLTAEEVMRFPPANRMALIDKGYIMVWPRAAEPPIIKGHRYAVHIGGGAYDVIEGRKLNDKPLSKDEAKALATGKTEH